MIISTSASTPIHITKIILITYVQEIQVSTKYVVLFKRSTIQNLEIRYFVEILCVQFQAVTDTWDHYYRRRHFVMDSQTA